MNKFISDEVLLKLIEANNEAHMITDPKPFTSAHIGNAATSGMVKVDILAPDTNLEDTSINE